LCDDAWIGFDDDVRTFVEIESAEFTEGGLDSGFFYFFECAYSLGRGDKILGRFDSHGVSLAFVGREGIGYCCSGLVVVEKDFFIVINNP